MAGLGKRLYGLGVAAVVGVVGLGTSPAHSQCVEAVVYVTREGGSPIYVYGEHDPCVAPTPWGHTVTYHGETTRTGLPIGVPNGYWIDLRVPAP